MSSGSDTLSVLIAHIYDAAIEPSQWPAVLENIGRFVPGCHANLLLHDAVDESANTLFVSSDDLNYRRRYLDQGARLNPVFQALRSRNVGEVYSASDIIPPAQDRRTLFYKEWQQPQGLIDAVAAVLDRSPTSGALIAVPRHQSHGVVDAASRQRMRLIVPHLRRAVTISRAVDFQNASAMLADAFDAFAASIYLVDAGGRIVHANRSGAELLAQTDILSRRGDHLRANDPDVDRTLRRVFALAGTSDEAAIGDKGVGIAMTSRDGERYLAHALPLTSGARRRARPEQTVTIAVIVHKAQLHRTTVVNAVAERFRLTPTELRVLSGIIEVGCVPGVAPALGIGEQTVKTHLKRLFAKTGTGRQAELVKLVAEFANPLVG
jgi:PAS domain-containing protein